MEQTNTSRPHSDLESLPIRQLFWRYAIPAITAMVVNGIYSLIDGIFIGRAIGAEGLAALNFSWPLTALTLGVGVMIGMGTGTWMSILRGQNDHTSLRRYIGNAFLLVIFFGLLFPVILLPMQELLLSLLGASGRTHALANDYLWILNISSFASLAGTALPLMIRNDERPHLTTLIMITGAIINIILDWLFIIVLNLETTGAALGTILAQCAAGLLSILYFMNSRANTQLFITDLRFSWSYSIQTLSTGLPSLLMFCCYGCMLAINNRLLIDAGGVLAVGAFTIVGYLQGVYYLFAEGIATGVQPLVSYNHGAKNYPRLLATLSLGLKTVLITGISSVILINLFPEVIASVFNQDNIALQQMTITSLRLHLFSMFLDGFIVMITVWFQSMAKSQIARWIAASNILVQLPMLIILPYFFGITGIWIALPISHIIIAIPVTWLLVINLRQLKSPLSLSKTTHTADG